MSTFFYRSQPEPEEGDMFDDTTLGAVFFASTTANDENSSPVPMDRSPLRQQQLQERLDNVHISSPTADRSDSPSLKRFSQSLSENCLPPRPGERSASFNCGTSKPPRSSIARSIYTVRRAPTSSPTQQRRSSLSSTPSPASSAASSSSDLTSSESPVTDVVQEHGFRSSRPSVSSLKIRRMSQSDLTMISETTPTTPGLLASSHSLEEFPPRPPRSTTFDYEQSAPVPRLVRAMSVNSAVLPLPDFGALADTPTPRATSAPPPSPLPEYQPKLPHVTIFEGRKRNRISAETMCDIANGVYNHLYDHILIVDCRYLYEYAGGHIKNARNIRSFDEMDALLFNTSFQSGSLHDRLLIVFHCEYSQKRGPGMHDHVREKDRRLNLQHFPALSYPEMYVLDGGYKGFFEYLSGQKDNNVAMYCQPPAYVGMFDERFHAECQVAERQRKEQKASSRQLHRSNTS